MLTKKDWEKLKKNKINVTDSYIKSKIEERAKAKNKGDFSLADKIREELSSKGILIEDQKTKQSEIKMKKKKYIFLILP